MFKDILGDAFPVIEKVAPAIASAIASPAAGVVTTFAITLLAHAFGLTPDGVKKLGAAIMDSPDANDRLSGLEETFSNWFKNILPTMRFPSKAEINVKLEWNNTQQSV